MAILTKMRGIPLFTTIQEAIKWAKFKRLNGYHVHYWQGEKGYMGGFTHAQAFESKRIIQTKPLAPVQQLVPTPTKRVTRVEPVEPITPVITRPTLIPTPIITTPIPTPTPTPTPAPTPYVGGNGGGGY